MGILPKQFERAFKNFAIGVLVLIKHEPKLQGLLFNVPSTHAELVKLLISRGVFRVQGEILSLFLTQIPLICPLSS